MAKKDACECMPMHHGHHGWKMLVAGLLVLANAYWAFLSWPYFIGGLAVLGGLVKMIPCKCK